MVKEEIISYLIGVNEGQTAVWVTNSYMFCRYVISLKHNLQSVSLQETTDVQGDAD